jgi:hypothetical protein
MGDYELIFSNYPDIYVSLLLNICHLCIRIIPIFVKPCLVWEIMN